MDLNTGRSRAPNFTEEEQILLRELLEPYMRIIESRKTDCVKQAQKQEAWTEITRMYNAKTKHVSRSMESLISCYRNMKTKMKRQYSDASIGLRDTKQKEEFLVTKDSHSKDGGEVGTAIKNPLEICENIFPDHNKELKNRDGLNKKNITATDIPHIEDVTREENRHTDGESEVHATSLLRCKPITQLKPTNATTDIKNKSSLLSSALISKDKAEEAPLKKRRNLETAFIALSQQKLELVKLQKISVEMDIEHKKRMHELEWENLVKQNNHQEEMRRKEILLIDLKIEAAKNGKF